MHSSEREQRILDILSAAGFVTFRQLETALQASPATIRRDLTRLASTGQIERLHGGARMNEGARNPQHSLEGVPFHVNIAKHRSAKEAIGKAAAALCTPGEGVMIDGGSTTLQMCSHLANLNLQVLTNSLHIVSALLPQSGTRILVPSGTVFREQNIILAAAGEESMPRFHAPKLFMGAAAIGPQGLMQADIVLVAAERRLIERAEKIIVLIDSSKFQLTSGNVVCDLEEIDMVVTDSGLREQDREILTKVGIELLIVDPE